MTRRSTASSRTTSGASIHEVAQVVVAASLVGTGTASTLATATTAKLTRVALLAPMQVVSSAVCAGSRKHPGPVIPLFLLGFLAAIAIRSTGMVPAPVLDVAATTTTTTTTFLLGAAMFGLGTGIVARQLWPVPGRALALATISTSVAALTSLLLVSAWI